MDCKDHLSPSDIRLLVALRIKPWICSCKRLTYRLNGELHGDD